MADRSCISLYYGDKLAQVRGYNGIDYLDLLVEAVAIAVTADDCINWQSYRSMYESYIAQSGEDIYSDEYEKTLESVIDICSFEISIDRDARIITLGTTLENDAHKEPVSISQITSVEEAYDSRYLKYDGDYIRKIRKTILQDEDISELISLDIYNLINMQAGREVSSGN